ncbi:hypothetical protein AS9A_4069 [Hoyosella subflava DQS3-9A1]|uniref:Uncharacterized protein n=1 Tax=Hoyosella subflava (strain DSM 45089 / JCM 17490 / NBRC 109087 / DQS3-9A1) TaxID=443218 RepID=F6EJ87_HOYSD|nr:hypothetical protein AS9A_4069 [Hoyosella subflava DQS3-9A1]
MTLALLVFLVCAALGAAATVPQSPSRAGLFGVLAVGQIVTHSVVALGSAHGASDGHHDAAMVAAHIIAIGVGSIVIHSAERACAAVSSTVKSLISLIVMRPMRAAAAPSLRSGGAPPRVGRSLVCASGGGTRGPPW